MILKLRNSVITKGFSITMIVVMVFTLIVPANSFALTGGPAQPEFNAFTPIGTSDMVDLSSGDFSYNIPIMDIGGFPINLAYNSGVTMDQEATWVGLGWNLSIGQINRQMRGIPDDFDGDEMTYENNSKPNTTVGASFTVSTYFVGVKFADGLFNVTPGPLQYSLGLTAQYNNYTGFSLAPSAGVTYDISNNLSVGLSARSDENGMSLSPNVSLHASFKDKENRNRSLGSNIGLSFNSRQGLSKMNIGMTLSRMKTVTEGLFRSQTSKGMSGGVGSSISFVDNDYTPTVEHGLTSFNFTFNAALGSEIMGAETPQGDISAYSATQSVPAIFKSRDEKAYGYDNTEKASKYDVKDFNREKDGNYSVNSTNLPVTNYTYDIYSVQGQGVGGMFRPYRSQVGYVNDNYTANLGTSVSFGGEFGGGNAFHTGLDIENSFSYGESGPWIDKNDALAEFEPKADNSPEYEEVYYKNVGDPGIDEEMAIFGTSTTALGQYSPIRVELDNSTKFSTTAKDNYQIKNATAPNGFTNSTIDQASITREKRVKRNQNIQKVRVDEVDLLSGADLLGFSPNSNAQPHHTAGFIITRNDGARYIYGDALYNTEKHEVTFSVDRSNADCGTGLVTYTPGTDNSVNNKTGNWYYNRIKTPAYAHTYLLTTLLSTDYSDIDGVEGPSDGDLGSYTKFNYSPNSQTYKWRVPFEANSANYSEGLNTDPNDDKGSYVYGVKQTKYLETIETKTHIAVFETSTRTDGKGVAGENGGLGSGTMEQLDKISLYSKAEYYDLNGNQVANPTPIKVAHFVYSNELCQGAGNATTGKLTLTKVYFTYRNSNMGQYNAYEFSYGDTDHDGTITVAEDELRNPDYDLKSYDIWGSYKANELTGSTCDHSDELSVSEFNYTEQEDQNINDYASAWSITDIGLPSGGTIQVDYEADDYQYVQDKKAMRMFKVVGAGYNAYPGTTTEESGSVNNSSNVSTDYTFDPNNGDYALLFKSAEENSTGDQLEARFLYIKLPEEDNAITWTAFEEKYLADIFSYQKGLVQFRFLLNMNKEGGLDGSGWDNDGTFDYVSGYFELLHKGSIFTYDADNDGTDETYASVRTKLVDLEGGVSGGADVNPIAKSGWQFGRRYLSNHIHGLVNPNTGNSSADDIVNGILQTVDNLVEIFAGANGLMRTKKIGRRFIPHKSWIRLGNPNGAKRGGGCRVSRIAMTDKWDVMTANEESGNVPDESRAQEYGQEYTYLLEDGTSSGVATYEPVGSKENPFVQPVYVNKERLLAPDEQNYMEKPFGESFFPGAKVTYSRVSVRNLERVDTQNNLEVKKHATGHVVTEFYTSKDYPTIVDQTELKVYEDKNELLAGLLDLNVKKYLTLTQGYVIHTNDMNGKMKAQRVYAEGHPDYISGVDYIYDGYTATAAGAPNPYTLVVHNDGNLNNEVLTLSPGGQLEKNTLGVEYDIINDFREKSSVTEISGVNGNLASFLVALFPSVVPMLLPDFARHKDKLQMTTTTKVIQTYGILRETIAHDAGASVSTRNLVWDKETGEVLLTETVNEFNQKYYSMNFPGHWAYEGMGMAYRNSGVTFPVTNIAGAEYEPNVNSPFSNNVEDYLFDGDEILYWDTSTPDDKSMAWVINVDDLANTFDLIDEDGSAIAAPTVDYEIKVIRSGRRNLHSASMGSVVLQENPIDLITVGGSIPNNFLASTAWDDYKIINAGAVEFSDDWELPCECGLNPLDPDINEYRYNVKGVWRANKSHLYLTKRHHTSKNSGATDNPDPRNNGFFASYSPFYNLSGGEWTSNPAGWTWTSEVVQFNPYGFEIENKDALNRYSSAQYGYNFKFPMAVGANSKYSQLGFDGFEDYDFTACSEKEHFGFRSIVPITSIDNTESHTGKFSLKVASGQSYKKVYQIDGTDCFIGN